MKLKYLRANAVAGAVMLALTGGCATVHVVAGAADIEAAARSSEARTTTFAPSGVRWYRSMTSWFNIRMQPEDTFLPIVHGSFVPWIR